MRDRARPQGQVRRGHQAGGKCCRKAAAARRSGAVPRTEQSPRREEGSEEFVLRSGGKKDRSLDRGTWVTVPTRTCRLIHRRLIFRRCFELQDAAIDRGRCIVDALHVDTVFTHIGIMQMNRDRSAQDDMGRSGK